ncbi:MAG: tetratricopeptide repeat protein [Candidatus Thorarchaeota archaeon]
MRHCPYCERQIKDDWLYCRYCNKPLISTVDIGLSKSIQHRSDGDSLDYRDFEEEDVDFDINIIDDEGLKGKLNEIDNLLKEKEILGEPVGDLLLNKASVYYKQRDLDKALKNLEMALKNFRSEGKDLQIAICHNEIGLIQEESGFFEEAIYHFERALDILNEKKEYHKVSQVLNNLGNVYLQINDIEHSYESYQLALNLAEKEDLDFEAIKSASNLVETLFKLRDYDRIKKILLNNASYFEKHNDIYGMIQTLIKYGKFYYLLGEDTYELSYQKLQQALTLIDKIKDRVSLYLRTHLEWECYLYMGLLAITWDDDTEAESLLLKSLEAIRTFEIRENIKEGLVLESLAKLYTLKGEDQKAIDYYNIALEIYEKFGDKPKTAEIKHNIGKIYYDFLQDQINAIQYLEDSLEIYEDLNYWKQSADISSFIGDIFNKGEKFELANSFYTRAKNFYIELQDNYNSSILEKKIKNLSQTNKSS